jgi:hypothetical protein
MTAATSAGVGMPEMASSPDRVVVVAAMAVLVPACNRETAGDETAEVDVVRGRAVEGVEWWSEDMMIAAATITTTRDARATVVTKARLRRLGRSGVAGSTCTGARGSVVSLACSHRASGHDIDWDVRSQFGIGGGRSRSGSGSQTGAGGDFVADPAADAATGSDADSDEKCTTSSTFALRCGVAADPASDSSKERRSPPT